MSTICSFRVQNISNEDKDNPSLFEKRNSVDNVYNRSDVVDREKNIPNIFDTPGFNCLDDVLYPSSIIKRERDIPNIFNFNSFQADSTNTFNYTDNFFDYPNLFTLYKTCPKPHGCKSDIWEKYCNYTSVFSLSDFQHTDCAQHLEINNSDDAKKEQLISDDKFSHESKEIYVETNNLEKNESNKTDKHSIEEEEKISSALCFWYISTGINVRDHNIKTYFPQREISSLCIMQDIKLMLINMGTTYFLVDQETLMYKRNGNISISGLTPEMFESATDPILKCSNLYKIISNTINKWKDMCDNSIIKAFIFSASNILDDYERSIYAVSNESLLSLVDRISLITPRLQLLANICCLKTQDCIVIPENIPCGIKLLNKIHSYLFEYRFSNDLFLKMLIYIFESCCLAYFKFLSNWALKGVLNNEVTGMFIQVKPDIEDEDTSSRRNWDRFTIDESIEVPIFLNKYKSDILNCGKTINFFKNFNDLNVFLPNLICCFDAIDTQKAYEKFSTYFKYDPGLKVLNCVKRMSNCYLYESTVGPNYLKENTDSHFNENVIITNVTDDKIYSDSENYELFQMPDWTSVNNIYEFNKPYGFFSDNNDPLTYNGNCFDVVNMIDYIPHSILIPARIQKSVCDKQILDMYFVQENLMGHLYYLSQCFFLMNWSFSSKLCTTLFDGIVTNRRQPSNIFNPVKLKSIVDDAIQDSFTNYELHDLTLEMTFIPSSNGIIDISDVECIELNYSPKWPMNMILSNKILLKYRRMFLFANKLEFVSWSLLKAREILNVYKNDTGLQFRKINLFKHWMNQFVSSIQQYYKQVVISTCWSELNENFENVKNYDDLFACHKQYMHTMLKRCLMVVGFKDKLILLNKIYIEILAYYQALASGQFYMKNSERLHSEFISMEQSFSRFLKLREMFYTSILKTVQTQGNHHAVQLESLVTILGPLSNNFT
ncbi:gamma-tubulin complex component 6-like isoform X1 [Rhopalosiphum padi]|uniref:gamma-tubulin complex component 6-like isoform X1 n=1 Tax=Rhopalosiphum padi TaxID=40932 RepID=UPI00298DEF1A|nr:gamma-tubulin complex component 6-like isoform X1 [Rhopalosiphum padi]XP_060839024.1 gamma-tubulin complex component 6-like isoform X1 [Rhopalosiphum padi]